MSKKRTKAAEMMIYTCDDGNDYDNDLDTHKIKLSLCSYHSWSIFVMRSLVGLTFFFNMASCLLNRSSFYCALMFLLLLVATAGLSVARRLHTPRCCVEPFNENKHAHYRELAELLGVAREREGSQCQS